MREVRPARDIETLLALVRLFRDERYDVVHTHSSKAGVLGRLLERDAPAHYARVVPGAIKAADSLVVGTLDKGVSFLIRLRRQLGLVNVLDSLHCKDGRRSLARKKPSTCNRFNATLCKRQYSKREASR